MRTPQLQASVPSQILSRSGPALSPCPTPALTDSSAKMERLSNSGSGAVGRRETWSQEMETRQGQSCQKSPLRGKDKERGGSPEQCRETRGTCIGHGKKADSPSFGPEPWGSVFYSEPLDPEAL